MLLWKLRSLEFCCKQSTFATIGLLLVKLTLTTRVVGERYELSWLQRRRRRRQLSPVSTSSLSAGVDATVSVVRTAIAAGVPDGVVSTSSRRRLLRTVDDEGPHSKVFGRRRLYEELRGRMHRKTLPPPVVGVDRRTTNCSTVCRSAVYGGGHLRARLPRLLQRRDERRFIFCGITLKITSGRVVRPSFPAAF